jgi:glutathione S-transferase
MTIILYGSPFSQPTRVVHWFLMSNNIPFKFQLIDVTKGEHRTPEFLAMNPHHTVPVLRDTDGSTIFESQAIMYYLRERYGDKANLFPGILGGDLKHRTRMAQFLSWYPAGLRGALAGFLYPVVIGPAFMKAPVPDATVQASLYNKAVDAIRVINDHWVQDGFIAGFKPTIADFQCYSELQQMTMARFDFSAYSNIMKFFSMMASLPHHDVVFGPLFNSAQNMPRFVAPTSRLTTVLVTGANGNTGSAVARALLQHAQKLKIRVIVGARRPDTLNEFVSKGAEARIVDFEDPSGAISAMRGVDAIWITAPNPAKTAQPYDRTNLAKKGIDAAKAAGVKFVLLGSVAGAEYEAIMFGKEFRDLEKYLESSGLGYCHLRMAAFAENVLMSQGSFAQGVWY